MTSLLAPDEAAETRLKHFKSFALPGYDSSHTQAVILFSRAFETDDPFRALTAVLLEKRRGAWRVVARRDFDKSDFNVYRK